MPPFLIPKPPSLLRVSESQAISNSSSIISSASSSSLFDRFSETSSGYLTDSSSPFTPSTAEFGDREGEGETQPSDSPVKEQVSLPSRYHRELFPSQSRLPRPTKGSLSTRLDRACTLGSRSSARSYSQKGTPFVSLIPIAATRNEDQRYHPASHSEDTFDAIAILRNRIERGNQTLATRRALEIMDSSRRPGLNESLGRPVEAPVMVVVSAPDSPLEDWSNDFELDSSRDVDVSILFPSASDRSLLDEVDQDSFPSPISLGFSVKLPSTPVLNPVILASPGSPFLLGTPLEFSVKLPSTPVLNPVILASPGSPFFLGTPDLTTNWEGSSSTLSTVMAKSPPSPILSLANMSIDEEEMARIMHTVFSLPTRTRHPLSGSPEGDFDLATVMRVEIASTFPAGRTGRLIGLGVAMPVVHPPLPPTLFPLHHPPGTALNSRSLRDLGYQSFDDRMFEIEQTTLALFSRNVREPSLPDDIETELSGPRFEINESLLATPFLPEDDFDCSGAFQVEQTLSQAHTAINHTLPIASGQLLVGLGLGLDILPEASVEYQTPPAEPSPTTGRHSLVSANGSVAEGEVALPLVSDFYLQAQKSFNFEPSGVQKTIELDASQLERQSALYNLEHSEILPENIFSHSPPIHLEKKTEIERQLLANLFRKKSRHHSKLKRNSSKMLKKLGLDRLAIFQPRSGRDDLDLASPTIAPQDDPRSPNLSTLDRVFLAFSSIKPSEMPTSVKRQSSVNVPKSEVPSKAMHIGLGLPSRVVVHRKTRLQEISQRIDVVRCRSNQESPNSNTVQSGVEKEKSLSFQFLKPFQFTERSLYDIAEVPTPPSSTSVSPRGTPSPRNHQLWSGPFIRLNPPQKRRKSFRTQLSSAPSTGSPHDDTEVASIVPSPKAPAVAAARARPGFKRYVSKFTRDLFKRSRSSKLKTSDSVSSSPVFIEHLDVAPGLTSSISAHNLQLLF